MNWDEMKAAMDAEADIILDNGNDNGWKGCLAFGILIVILTVLAVWICE